MKPKQDSDAAKLSSDRQKWQKVFDALVGIITKQQSQLQALVAERKLLEDRIRTQQKFHDSGVDFLKDRISQMKGALAVQEMIRSLDARKLELAVGLKQREALLHKLKLHEAELELVDFRECLDILSAKCANPKHDCRDNSPRFHRSKRLRRESGMKSAEGVSSHDHTLEDEMRRLKSEFDTLVSEKNSEVSALLTEKKFAWNQYHVMETNLTNKLKSKEAEFRLTNDKVSVLLDSIQKLQSSSVEKDDTIAKLKSKVADKEATARKRDDEIIRLTHELEVLRRARCTSETPRLSRCTTPGSTASSVRDKISARVTVNNQPAYAPQVPDSTGNSKKGGRVSKRKVDDIDSPQVTPKLFSSSFKVPKLKTPSIQIR